MSARMSASSIVAHASAAEPWSMQDLLICAGFVVLLIVLDLVATRFGVDSRDPHSTLWNTETRPLPWVWW
jgi:hypothetical protein